MSRTIIASPAASAAPPARQGAKMPVRIPGMKVLIAIIAGA